MKIFIDSSVLCAYLNTQDVNNKRASEIMKELLLTEEHYAIINDCVFNETLSIAVRRTNKKTALLLGRYLISSQIYLMGTNEDIFQTAWKYFHGEWNFSFTDCTILAFMRIFGIQKIATFDQEFKKIKDIEVIS